MKKILVITDMQFIGSGYYYIAVNLFKKLAEKYNIRILGTGYNGEEHNYPFQVLPIRDYGDMFAMAYNIVNMPEESPDVILVAFDIPQQLQFFQQLSQHNKPYIAITPLENPPLTLSWAAGLMSMNFVFFISELGKQAALKAGLTNVDHLHVGVDTKLWHIPTPEEHNSLRQGMGIEDDEFVILTVAENQERKNLWAALSVTAQLKEKKYKVRHVIVTRTESQFGWNMRDLANYLGVNKEMMLMNRGMPKENLWSLYAMSDCFLLTSKAEGLGLPVLEAMGSGLPVVATDTGAITELLSDNRGHLVPGYPMGRRDYFIDVWGNEERVMIDIEKATEIVARIIDHKLNGRKMSSVINARAYVETLNWDVPAAQVSEKIEEITNV